MVHSFLFRLSVISVASGIIVCWCVGTHGAGILYMREKFHCEGHWGAVRTCFKNIGRCSRDSYVKSFVGER